MQKKLVSVGNSVALILDKDIRFALGLKRTSLVKLRTDGKCLIVEPDGVRPEPGVALMSEEEQIALYLPKEFDAMSQRMGLTHEVFRRLHHCPAVITDEMRKKRSPTGLWVREMSIYAGWLYSNAAATNTTDAEWATMRRFHLAYQTSMSGLRWDDVAVHVLEQIPMVCDPDAKPVNLC